MGIPASPESVSEHPAEEPAQPGGARTPPEQPETPRTAQTAQTARTARTARTAQTKHFRRIRRLLRMRSAQAVLALPGQERPADRYYEDTSRDFSAVYAR